MCPTLCNPMDSSPPGSWVHGILQSRILEWVAMPCSRGSSQPKDWIHIICVSYTTKGFFTTEPLGKPIIQQMPFKSPKTVIPPSFFPLSSLKKIPSECHLCALPLQCSRCGVLSTSCALALCLVLGLSGFSQRTLPDSGVTVGHSWVLQDCNQWSKHQVD